MLFDSRRFALLCFVLSLSSASEARLGRVAADLSRAIPSALVSKAQVPSSGLKVVSSVLDGTNINEYVDQSGIVYAVTWKGVAHPDFNEVLGDYFQHYDSAARRQLPAQRTKKSATVVDEQIVVHLHGHMRDIRGTAYLPSRLPAGVQVEDLK